MANIAEAQVKNRIAAVLGPGSGDEKEFMKGEIAGIRLFMQLPETALENIKLEMEKDDDDANEA